MNWSFKYIVPSNYTVISSGTLFIKQVEQKLNSLTHEHRSNVFKALAIDKDNLDYRSEAYFLNLNGDPTLASYEFNYYSKRRFLLF